MKSKLIAIFVIILATTLGFRCLPQAEDKITNNLYEDGFPCIKDNYLVWQGRVDGDWEVFLYDITTKETTQITTNGYNDISPQTDGKYVVWLAFSDSGGEIFLYDILSKDTYRITTDNKVDSPPQIANGLVVWTSHEVTTSVENGEIILYDIVNATKTPLSASVDPEGTLDDSCPRINDEKIVWVQANGQDTKLFIHDIATGTSYEAPDGFVWKDNLERDGDRMVSTPFDGNDKEIVVHENSLRSREQITDNVFDDRYPCISGNNIAWVGGKGESSEIFLAVFPADPCAEFGGDVDEDELCSDFDNCPNIPNPDQEDMDSDGIGDACDPCDNRPINGSVSPSIGTLWPPNHNMIPVTIDVSALEMDNSNDTQISITSVTILENSSQEAGEDYGENIYDENNFEPDVEIVGDLTLNLRSERSGASTGRTYTITITASDCSGSFTFTTDVVVPHDKGK